MTREEAFAFLELPVTATAAEIKTRITEKLAYFEMQSEKAPSDFLRRLSLRNLGKVKAILKDSAPWTSFITQPEPAPQENPVVDVAEESAQTVYIVSSLKDAVVKQSESQEIKKKRSPDEPAGWLIKHTEGHPVKTYPVQTGVNFVGRKQQASLAPFIVVEGDDFISRVQCVMYAEEEHPLEFYISDPSAFNKGKTSKNGTYINGNPVAVTEKIKLADGDTIQMGITKFVLRYNTAEKDELVKEVEQSKYTDTVLLEE
jgi:hypothetical protein